MRTLTARSTAVVGVLTLASLTMLAVPSQALLPGVPVVNLPTGILGGGLGVPAGVTVTGVGTTVVTAAAPAGPPGEVVAGAVLATGAALYGYWQLGDLLGSALPCLNCPKITNEPVTPAPRYGLHSSGALAGKYASFPFTYDGGALGADCIQYQPCDALRVSGDAGYLGAGFYVKGQPGDETTTYINSMGTFNLGNNSHRGYPFTSYHIHDWNTGVTIAVLAASPDPGTPAPAPTYGPAQPAAQLIPRTTEDCRGPEGTTTVTADGAPFLAGDAAYSSIPFPACPPGTVRSKVHTDIVPVDGSTGITPTPVIDTPALPATSPFPGTDPCLPGGAAAPCPLTPTYNPPDPDPQTQPDPTPTRPWDPAHDPHPTPDPGPNGDPSTPPATDPWGCEWGGVTITPSSCDPIWNDPHVPPYTPTDPTDPVEPTVPGADGTDCLGNAVSLLKPWTWVTGPVKCALTWAFVPKTSSVAGIRAAGAGLGGTVPFSYMGDAVGWLGTFAPGHECFTINVSTPWGPRKVISTCDPDEFTQNVMGPLRPVLTVGVYAMFVLPIAWWGWRQYAPGSTGSA